MAKGRIRRRAPEFDPKRLGEDAVVLTGKTLQIPQALAFTKDPEHGNKQHLPSRDANAPPHAGIQNRLEEADQIEIGGGRNALAHREEAIPPPSTHARSPGKKDCACL